MKKVGFMVFLFALAVGSILSAATSFGNFGNFKMNFGRVQGSGTPKIEIREVSDFEAIKANGALNVEITAQKDFGVEIEADDNLLEYIRTETEGGILKIYTEGNISPKSRINVKISMPELNSLSVNGASTALVSNVKSDSLKVKVNGASKIKIDGEVVNLKTQSNGASGINAENLKAENADVEVNGASNTIVWATNELKADASGAGSISYAGEPQNVIQKSSGAGSIKKK